MLATISGFIETFVSIIVKIIAASYILGRLIITILSKTSDVLGAVASTIGTYAVNFYEDFKMFMLDIEYQYGHIIKMMNNGINNWYSDLYAMTVSVRSSVEWTGEQAKSETMKLANGALNLFTYTAISLRNWIVLIGNSAWMLLMCIPNLTLLVVHHIFKFVTFVWKSIVDSVKVSANIASDSFSVTLTFFTSVPLQSICGLLSICLLIKYRSPVFWLLRLIGRTIARISMAFIRYTLVGILHPTSMLLQYVIPIRNFIPNIWRLSPIREDYADPTASGSSKITDPYHFCVICQDKLKSIVLLPCRHLCLCGDCFKQLRRYRRDCPICRQTYIQSIQVYAWTNARL